MEHEVSHSNPGFGKNTNGLGLFIVAISLVVLALAAYWFWHKGAAEDSWYRFENTTQSAGHGEGHEATSGHEEKGAEAKPEAAAVADSTKASHDSTAAEKPAADSAAHH